MLLLLPNNECQETILPSNVSVPMVKDLAQKHKAAVHPSETAVLMNRGRELLGFLNIKFKFSAPVSAE